MAKGSSSRSIALILALLGLLSGGYLYLNKEIEGLEQVKIVPREKTPKDKPATLDGELPPVTRQDNVIRIASFNIQVFGQSKSRKPQVMDILARVVRNFDVVAIQEIRAKNQSILPDFVTRINSTGRHYDYVIGPRQGRTSSKEQYAFIFDTASIVVDRNQTYSIRDEDDLLHRPPLVTSFRVRGPPPEEAFTFTLVNIHTDPDETKQELDALADVYHAVCHDGLQEDDVIILGDLNVDDRHMGRLGKIPGISWVVSGTPTNTRQTAQYDNLVFHKTATVEFNGRGGVFDFMRQYNLTKAEALTVSDHMPIWAEFSIYEGGKRGSRIATRPPAYHTAP